MTAGAVLAGKRILLVGATGVLGRAFSRALAESGARLTLADRAATDVLALAGSLGADGRIVDVTDESSVAELVRDAVAVHGGLDGVVSNAAVTSEALMREGDGFAPFEDYPLALWRTALDVNLTGTFLVAREGGKVLKAGGGGSLVLTSSIYGTVAPDHPIYDGQPFRSFAGYSASKAGVIGLARWLATWWAHDAVRVNALSPGGVFNGQPDSFVAAYANRTPMGRMANAEDIVGMLIFLLSDASTYCTGQNFVVDGGLSAW
jgi:NAD(P)-dependent dehydrogenase (short-subunit alcohol dehydrogenase family)